MKDEKNLKFEREGKREKKRKWERRGH